MVFVVKVFRVENYKEFLVIKSVLRNWKFLLIVSN